MARNDLLPLVCWPGVRGGDCYPRFPRLQQGIQVQLLFKVTFRGIGVRFVVISAAVPIRSVAETGRGTLLEPGYRTLLEPEAWLCGASGSKTCTQIEFISDNTGKKNSTFPRSYSYPNPTHFESEPILAWLRTWDCYSHLQTRVEKGLKERNVFNVKQILQ